MNTRRSLRSIRRGPHGRARRSRRSRLPRGRPGDRHRAAAAAALDRSRGCWRGSLASTAADIPPGVDRPAGRARPVARVASASLVIGGPDETPSPMPGRLARSAAPARPRRRRARPARPRPARPPTDAAVELCPGYADAADARTLDDGRGVAWQAETGPPPPIESRREGRIAAFARALPGGRPAVVLIDPATGEHLPADRPECAMTRCSSSSGRRAATRWPSPQEGELLVLSSAGLTELHRAPAVAEPASHGRLVADRRGHRDRHAGRSAAAPHSSNATCSRPSCPIVTSSSSRGRRTEAASTRPSGPTSAASVLHATHLGPGSDRHDRHRIDRPTTGELRRGLARQRHAHRRRQALGRRRL